MEDWKLDFEWLRIRHEIKDKFKRSDLPDLNAVLFLIGINELGDFKEKFTKEEKQDLMHVAVCKLLSQEGHYVFTGRDEQGWPHYQLRKKMDAKGVKEQENIIIKNIIKYFNQTNHL